MMTIRLSRLLLTSLPLGLMMSLANAAVDCSASTARTTVIYCNDFESSLTAWNPSVTFTDMDSTLISTRYGGTEVKSPTLTVRGVDASVTGSLIQQQHTVETILVNNPTPIAGQGAYIDAVNPGANYTIGMFTGGPGTQSDILAFTFDAQDAAQTGLPFVIVEVDAATIPLHDMNTGLARTPVLATPNVLNIAAYDGFDGYFDSAMTPPLLTPIPAGWVSVVDVNDTLATPPVIATGDANINYPVIWKKLKFKLALAGLNPLNLNHTVTLVFNPIDPVTGGYIIIDNLKISATDDSDGDGVPDAQEVIDGTDPDDAIDYKDTDGDGVPDYVEVIDGTDPNDITDYTDTDGDRVPDYVESILQPNQGGTATDPNDAIDYIDTDGDGVPDYVEAIDGTDPNDITDYTDTDGDLVPDYVESILQPNQGGTATDPNNAINYTDSDGDGVPDYIEAIDGTDPNDITDYTDTDGDRVPDYVETTLQPNQGGTATDETDGLDYADTDGDLVPNYVEKIDGTNPNDPSKYKDSDKDLVPDYVESIRQPNAGAVATNPTDKTSLIDTDSGGVPDYAETVLAPNLGLAAGNPANAADDAGLSQLITRALSDKIPATIPSVLALMSIGMVAIGMRRIKRRGTTR